MDMNTINVLLVEDVMRQQKAIVDRLLPLGFNFECCQALPIAQEIYAQKRDSFQLILLDDYLTESRFGRDCDENTLPLIHQVVHDQLFEGFQGKLVCMYTSSEMKEYMEQAGCELLCRKGDVFDFVKGLFNLS
jgi:CheY-like chemotaxis protein